MNEETARVRLENFAFFLKKTTNILHSNYFYNHLILKACIPRHRIVISPPVFAQSVWLYTVELRMPSVTRCHYTMSSRLEQKWSKCLETNTRKEIKEKVFCKQNKTTLQKEKKTKKQIPKQQKNKSSEISQWNQKF